MDLRQLDWSSPGYLPPCRQLVWRFMCHGGNHVVPSCWQPTASPLADVVDRRVCPGCQCNRGRHSRGNKGRGGRDRHVTAGREEPVALFVGMSVEECGRSMNRDVSGEDFASWVRPHLPAMVRAAASFGSRDVADDAVQEALERAWKHRRRFDPERGTARAWLVSIAVRRALSLRPRTTAHPLGAPTMVEGERTEVALLLRDLVDRLPRRQMEVTILFYYVDLSVATIAEVLGITEGAVKSTLSAARRSLQRQLEGAGVDGG